MLLLDELREAWRTEKRDHRVALAAIVAIAVVMRVIYLAQPMRYDEAVTYLEFVRRPLTEALSRYTYPNNHLFHTLLAKLAVGVFGNAPWALRLPAFFAGIAVVPATYVVGRAMYGARAGLLAAAFAATSGLLILFSTNARGYSLVVLAFLLLLLLARRIVAGPTQRLWLEFGVLAAVGLWTIPTMLFPLGAVCLWIALTFLVERRKDEWLRFAGALGIGAALTLLLYTPVLVGAGFDALARNQWVKSSPWPEFLSDMSGMTAEALRSWGLGLPPVFSIVLFACAVFALTRHARVTKSRVGLPLAVFVWCAWLLVISHRAPFARVWIWLFPLAAMLVGAGLVTALERWPRTRDVVTRRLPLLAVLLAASTGVSVVLSRAVLLTRDTGTYTDAARAAAILSSVVRAGDRVVIPLPGNAPLGYYMHRRNVDSTVMTLDQNEARRVYVIVDEGEGQSLDATVQGSPVRDTSRYSGRLISELPSSVIIVFERRHVAPR